MEKVKKQMTVKIGIQSLIAAISVAVQIIGILGLCYINSWIDSPFYAYLDGVRLLWKYVICALTIASGIILLTVLSMTLKGKLKRIVSIAVTAWSSVLTLPLVYTFVGSFFGANGIELPMVTEIVVEIQDIFGPAWLEYLIFVGGLIVSIICFAVPIVTTVLTIKSDIKAEKAKKSQITTEVNIKSETGNVTEEGIGSNTADAVKIENVLAEVVNATDVVIEDVAVLEETVVNSTKDENIDAMEQIAVNATDVVIEDVAVLEDTVVNSAKDEVAAEKQDEIVKNETISEITADKNEELTTTAKKPAVKKVVTATETAKKPAVKKAVTATETAKKPAVKKVVTATETAKKPAVKKVVTATETAKKPAVKKVVTATETAKKPAVKKVVTATETAKKPTVKKI